MALSVVVNNLKKSFALKGQPVNTVLNNVSLNVAYKEFVALMGASGVGKSTLLYLLGALDKPDSGEIILNFDKEYVISKLKDDKLNDIRNKNIGFVFQFHHLLPEFTALENVMLPALIAGESNNEAQKKALDLMERVGVGKLLKNKPMELSGGEQQRVAIARALVNRPQLLLADEPTGNLDSANAQLVMNLLKELRSEYELTLIIATHDSYIAQSADRVVKMADGKIIE